MKTLIAILFLTLPVKAQIASGAKIQSAIIAASMGHIIGADDRKLNQGVFPEKFPMVFVQAGYSGCSGTLIARDLVLTNFHCVLYQGYPTVFTKYHKGNYEAAIEGIKVFISSYVKLDGTNVAYSPLDDWAIIKLPQPISDKVGFCSLASSNPNVGTQISLAGYHGDLDNAIGIQDNCSVKRITSLVDQNNNRGIYILNDCDSVMGSSGSSVTVQNGDTCEVVALHKAHYSPLGSNLGKDQYYTVSRYDDTYASVAISVVPLLPIVEAIKNGLTSGEGFKTLHSENP